MRTVVTLHEDELIIAVREYITNHIQAGYKSELSFDSYSFQTTTTNKAFVDVTIDVVDEKKGES